MKTNLLPSPTTLSLLHELTQRQEQVVFVYQVSPHKFDYLNPVFETMWARTRTSILKNPALLLRTIHPEDLPYLTECYEEIFEDKKKQVEFRIFLPGKQERRLRLKAFLVEYTQGEAVIVGMGEDVTDQKAYQDNLQKFSIKKNSILEILAHDLAGPLGTIQGLSAQLAKDTEVYQNSRITQLIEMIHRTSSSGVHLIRDFIKQEFLESAQVRLLKSRVDLAEKLHLQIELYQQSQLQLAKTFILETSAPTIFVAIDEDKLLQAVNNLISNAIKFTPDEGHIRVSLQEKDQTVLLTVADNGIGIPLSMQAGLFEKFTRARRPGIRGEESVGLGMSIIKTIVEWHGGRIWFESKENEGSTFFVEIPKE